MKPLRLPAVAVALLLAGCTASPTDAVRASSAPRFDEGGNTTGSGNYAGDGVSNDGTTTVPVDTLTRGPGMVGSGN